MFQMIIKLLYETKNVKIHRFVSDLNKIVLKNAKLFQMKTRLCKNTQNCFKVEQICVKIHKNVSVNNEIV